MKILGVLFFVVLGILAAPVATAQVDYATKIQTIFDARCSCHAGGTSGLDVTNYTTVMASVGAQYGTKVVLPGNSAGSPIYNKISSTTPLHGQRMPRGGPYLSADEILTIKTWIDEGANAKISTAVLQTGAGVPETFSLSQNYPNPFNPTTRIAFTIPVAAGVTLKVFDITGREVAALVNGTVQPGAYSVEWNGANEASGIYFYRLEAGSSFTATKKFILQK